MEKKEVEWKLARVKPNSVSEQFLVSCISEHLLDSWLEEEAKNGIIGSEQWYRDPRYWFRVRSSPLYEGPKIEKWLLEQNSSELRKHLSKSRKVFYGVGIGDAEHLLVRWDFEESRKSSYSEIIGIDVCAEFLSDFADTLKSYARRYKQWTIKYLGMRQLFELARLEELQRHSGRFATTTFACLGNTVGNFDQDRIFNVFARNAKSGDLLLIGFYELGCDPRETVELYKNVSGFSSLVDAIISKILFIRIPQLEGLLKSVTWEFNPHGNWVEAKYGRTTVFRSKKYVEGELSAIARKYGFMEIARYGSEGVGVNLYKKLPS